MKKISYCFLFLLAFSVYAQKEKLPVISEAEQLKTVKGKQIIWQKDGPRWSQFLSNLRLFLLKQFLPYMMKLMYMEALE